MYRPNREDGKQLRSRDNRSIRRIFRTSLLLLYARPRETQHEFLPMNGSCSSTGPISFARQFHYQVDRDTRTQMSQNIDGFVIIARFRK